MAAALAGAPEIHGARAINLRRPGGVFRALRLAMRRVSIEYLSCLIRLMVERDKSRLAATLVLLLAVTATIRSAHHTMAPPARCSGQAGYFSLAARAFQPFFQPGLTFCVHS